MWCRQCQTDVVAEALPDNRRVLCATCGTDITPVGVAHDSAKPLRNPRDLLARWAEEDATDPLGPLYHSPLRKEPAIPATPAPEPRGVLPFVPSPVGVETPRTTPQPPVPAPTHSAPRRPLPLPTLYRHWQRPPESDSSASDDSPRDDTDTNRLRIVGQMFAYLGVLTLFVGSVLVLLGHFGNLAIYAPTGWIIATAGQMLLFLGVVTLVAAGLEQVQQSWRQSHAELVRRFDRLERSTREALSGDETSAIDESEAARPANTRSREQRIAELTAELDRLRAA
jgi:hypothetical protein